MPFFYKIKNNAFDDDIFCLTFLIVLEFDEIQMNFSLIIDNENFLDLDDFVKKINNDTPCNFFNEETKEKFIAINFNEQKEFEIYITDICFINKIKNKVEFINLFNDIRNQVVLLNNI